MLRGSGALRSRWFRCLQLHGVAQPQIPLWKRDLDAVLVEYLGNAHLQVVVHGTALVDLGNADAQFEILRVFTETRQEALWRRVGQHLRIRRGDLEQQLLRTARLAAL